MLDLSDVVDGVLGQFLPSLQLGDVPYRLEHVDGVFEKAQDVGGVEVDPVFIEEVGADLAVIEPQLSKLDYGEGELPLRAPAEGCVLAFAVHEVAEKGQELLMRSAIEVLEVDCLPERLQKRT